MLRVARVRGGSVSTRRASGARVARAADLRRAQRRSVTHGRGCDARIFRLKLSRISMAKRAIITGITGQDGSYLAELLLEQGYEVTGAIRRASAPNLWRIQHILDRLDLRPADLLDQLSQIGRASCRERV